jgi:hypothetical protein
VRHTVLRVVTADLREDAAVSWQGLNFGFTGVVFDGGDFSVIEFSGGTVDFRGARFSGGKVDFSGVWFSDVRRGRTMARLGARARRDSHSPSGLREQ